MSPAEKCPERHALERFVQGQIAEEEARAIEFHLLECAQCVQSAASVSTVVRRSSTEPANAIGSRSQSLDDLQQRLKAIWAQNGTVPDLSASEAAQQALEGDEVACRRVLQQPEPGSSDIGRLGPYAVRRIVGSGGMGLVLVAWDAALKREVALKVLKPALAAKAENRERFLREAQAAAALRNDHVIEIYHVGEDRGIPFLVMPLLEGKSLESRLSKVGPLPLPLVLRFGKEIAQGLAAAHAKRLIHRDIKPGNIWLEQSSDRVKILDFGLARELIAEVKLTSPDTILGSAAYMSPEQAEPGRHPVDGRTDLFSLGCVLYEMATGICPFQRAGLIRTLKAVVEEQPQAPHEVDSSIPHEFSQFVMQLLSKDPQERPTSATAVIESLDALESAATMHAPLEANQDEPVGPRAGRGPRLSYWGRSLWLATAAALLFAAGSMLFGVQIFRIVTNKGIAVIEVADPAIEVTVDDSSIIVRDGPARREITLAAGDHVFHVTVNDPSGPMSFDSDAVTITRGGTQVFNARQEIARHQARTKSAIVVSPQKEASITAASTAPSTAPATDGNRIAAEWGLATGGIVTVAAGGKEQALHPGQKLPEGEVRLLKVDLKQRPITGTGLETLERAETLKELNLSETDVTDSALTSIGKLVHLKELDLGGTKISEGGLQKLGGLTDLRALSLWGLNITDAGLKHLAGFKKLEVINLSYTPVTGTGFAELKDLKQLFYLRLHDSLVDDTSVQSIHDLPNDRALTLILSRTKLTDAGLSRLRGRSIWDLRLGGMPITDKGLTSLGITEMPYLTILRLPGTEVTDAGLATILQVRTLNDIDLSETNVSARGFASLKRVFPHAKILWSEPNVIAAHAVFKSGGTVSLRPRDESAVRLVKQAADLPLDFFTVTGVNLAGTKSPLADIWPTLVHPRLRELVALDLSDRIVSTDDIQQIRKLVHLRGLVLNRTQIRGEDLVLLQRLPELVELACDCPSLDLLLIEESGFPRLERLSLATSGITDDSVTHLARLASLKELDVRGTKLTAPGIAALKKSLPHCRIIDAGGKH